MPRHAWQRKDDLYPPAREGHAKTLVTGWCKWKRPERFSLLVALLLSVAEKGARKGNLSFPSKLASFYNNFSENAQT